MPSPENARLDQRPNSAPSANGTPPHPARPAPTPPARTHDLRRLSQALRRHWPLVLSAGLAAGVVVGCVVYATLPPSKYGAYTARASLRVSAASPLNGTIPARVKSRAVLTEVLERPDVKGLSLLAAQRDPSEYLQNELVVDWDRGPDVLTIRLRGDRPNELAALVNAVADATLRDVNADEVRGEQQRLERLERIHKDYEKSLDPRRRELEELTRRADAKSWQRTMRLVLAAAALNARQAELLRVQGERRNAEALLRLPRTRPADAAPVAETKESIDDVMKNDPDLQPLQTQIADLNGQIARYTALYKDNPDRAAQVIKEKGLQSRIDSLYALARQQHEKKMRALGSKGSAEAAREAADRIEELKARVASYEATEDDLSREIKKLEGDLRGLAVQPGETDAIRRDVAVRDAVSKDVATALEKLRLEGGADPRAAMLEEAAVPTVREERRLLPAGLAGLGAAALAMFGVAFLDLRRRKLHTVADVTRGLGLPVAGTQPLLAAELNPLSPRHAAAEGASPWYGRPNDSLDATRALLLRTAPPSAPRVVAVVAAAGGEGATVLAAHLAASLARAGRRTILLDANLRQPAVHRAFGLPAGPGFAEVLRGETVLPDAIRPAAAERLWVMPAGEADQRALLGLSRETVQSLLDQLKRDYEYVVIDCAPALPCADALLLAQRADAVLVSTLAGASAVPAVHEAWQRLSALGARLLGVVVQGAGDGMSGSRYGVRAG